MRKSEIKRILRVMNNYNNKISELCRKLEDAGLDELIEDLQDNSYDNPASAESIGETYFERLK